MNSIKKTSPFKFEGFYITESKIHIYREFISSDTEYSFKIVPKGLINESKKTFNLEMDVEIIGENNEKKTSLSCNVKIEGQFEFQNVEKRENLSNYFFTNAPAIIFPYVRSYIASLTALSGFNTINLPPINISVLRDDLKENTETIE